MTLEDIVKNFTTTPFLFVGSGLSRRYLDLPNWNGLLKHFAQRMRDDEFIYASYLNNRRTPNKSDGEILPLVASDIQKDFDEFWFYKPSFRNTNAEVLKQVHNGVSPFKAEVAEYIRTSGKLQEKYAEEIALLSEISGKSISGVITTNYDSFLEDHLEGYKKYVGQNELIFSAIQGIAEIYKIHGSVEKPESLVINADDYAAFEQRSKYLAAKLMTIFMEYPIIFMGYSLSDTNIQKIIQNIAECLTNKQLDILKDRFIFIDYVENMEGYIISDALFPLQNNAVLQMKRIQLSDYSLLYAALREKKARIPVKLLRLFKQEFYEFSISNEPTTHLKVALLDDQRIDDDDFAITIGRISNIGLIGLQRISADDWYYNTVYPNLPFSADDLLKYTFPELFAQNSHKIPFYRFYSQASQSHLLCENLFSQTFDDLLSPTIINKRQKYSHYGSAIEVWHDFHENPSKAALIIAHLPEEKIQVEELNKILDTIFANQENVLSTSKNPTFKTNLKRLIRIYDYLGWKK